MNRLAVMTLTAALAAVPLPSAFAEDTADAVQIPPAYRQVAREYDVPPTLLFAIALTESGRTTGNRFAPWPWTLNVDGQGYRYESRTAVEAALRDFLAQGRYPDVGLMQINWRYHEDLLGDVHQALDPWFNLRAGALVLREAYERTGDWWLAVGRYHSGTPDRALAYRHRVARWHRRIG